DQYERNSRRVNSPQGHYMKGKREGTVEPVFGTLTPSMGLRKVNTIGVKQANKCMHPSATAYNLEKHLKFTPEHAKSGAGMLTFIKALKNIGYQLNSILFRPSKKMTIVTI